MKGMNTVGGGGGGGGGERERERDREPFLLGRSCPQQRCSCHLVDPGESGESPFTVERSATDEVHVWSADRSNNTGRVAGANIRIYVRGREK